MSLDITKALSDGLSRTLERNGLVLMLVFLVFGLIDSVAGQTLSAAATRVLQRQLDQLPPDAVAGPTALPGAEQTPLALPVPLSVAFVLVVVLAFVAEAIRIVAVRTLVSDETASIPREFVSRNIVVATLNGFVGGVVVLILVGVGLLFLIVPGIFLAISFLFVRQEIAVEDENFLDALAASWELTSGHRLELFTLALVVFVVGVFVAAIGGLVGLAGPPILATLVGLVLGVVTTVFGVAVVSRAYVQLTTEDDDLDLDDDSEWYSDPV
ncbi:hypothetical protein [Salinigranum salinum]|uniref:hypothetical protein n=1 Tax=Salinigranum salinum TaxID=1364937 RepID=UPI001864183F|nr:hypothetical protein [Salinigranum salinum]